MSHHCMIALIGDYDMRKPAHVAIPQAIALAAEPLGCQIQLDWIPTVVLADGWVERLAPYDALWCVPGSPYASMQGALNAIRFGRQERRPFLGTCGGCQHALIEYARNVLGLSQADHAESNSGALLPLISPLACSLEEASAEIQLHPGSRVHAIYGQDTIIEAYNCRYGLNPQLHHLFEGTTLHITGTDANGEARVVELVDHPFFIGTLFQPERSAFAQRVHPLLTAYLQAVIAGERVVTFTG